MGEDSLVGKKPVTVVDVGVGGRFREEFTEPLDFVLVLGKMDLDQAVAGFGDSAEARHELVAAGWGESRGDYGFY